MKELEHIHFSTRESFRNWLKVNHDKSLGIWIIFYKKHVNIECIAYNEALEEALCFGWIDSLIKRIDNDQYVRKFTPRTNKTKWSEVNKKLVTALIKEGRMTEEGLKKIDIYVKTGSVDWENNDLEKERPKKEFNVPDFILKEFAKNEPALTNFNNLAQTHKQHYVLWITSAKREETILSRLNRSIELLKENSKLGLK
ncbi:MAG: YdeI/OmpD-associated family protein [Bacteroidales bacterium]|nr:YdeI/OmpD-associated family protein [Bacteroidales bacterium]